MLNIVKDLPTLLNYVTAEESAHVKTGVPETPNISGVRHRTEPNKPKPRNCVQALHGKRRTKPEEEKETTTRSSKWKFVGNLVGEVAVMLESDHVIISPAIVTELIEAQVKFLQRKLNGLRLWIINNGLVTK